MTNLLEEYNTQLLEKLSNGKTIPDFRAGDTVSVMVRIIDINGNERLQNFTGLCIRRRNRGVHSAFVLRKVNKNGGAVERLFPLYSPMLQEIKVTKYGIVRRAKLYYIRELFGKAARIKERRRK